MLLMLILMLTSLNPLLTSCTGPTATATDEDAAAAPAPADAEAHHDPAAALYLYHLDTTHIGLARCQPRGTTATYHCAALPYEAIITAELQGASTGWPASLAELTFTLSSQPHRSRRDTHSSQLASLATAVPGMLRVGAATISQISRHLPTITTAIAALTSLGHVKVLLRRQDDLLTQPGSSQFSQATPQTFMPFVSPEVDERAATTYPPLLPQDVAAVPGHRIVPFRRAPEREPNAGGPRTLLVPGLRQEQDSLISHLASSQQSATPTEVLECVQLLYPIDPGFLQKPRRSSPLRRFVPTLNPPHPDTLSDCLATLNQVDDPSLQLLIQERAYLTTAPHSAYQNWLRHDDTQAPAAGGGSSPSSGSAHHVPSRPAYIATVKMFAALDYAQVKGSGLFRDAEEFAAMQSQAQTFVEYLQHIDAQVSRSAVSTAGLEHYWYRVRLLDHLTTRARATTPAAPPLQVMELIRALKALSVVSTEPLATILATEAITTERESLYAHPSHSHDPTIHRSQLEHIVSRMIQLMAREAGTEPRTLRNELALLLAQPESSTHPATATAYSEAELMELQELIAHHEPAADLLSSFAPQTLSSGRMVSAMDIATIAAALGTDAASSSILTEYAHGRPWQEIYLHVHQYLASAHIKRELYRPVELAAYAPGAATTAEPLPSHHLATPDTIMLEQVAHYKFSLELVAELKAIRSEFVAMMQGITSADLTPAQWRGIDQDPLIQAIASTPPGAAINPDLISYLLIDMADTLWQRYTSTWSGAIVGFFKNQLHRLKYWHVITRLEQLKHATVQRPLVYHSVGDHLLELRTLLTTFQRRDHHPEDLPPEVLFELHKSPHLDLLRRHDPYVLPDPPHVLSALSELRSQLMHTRRYGVWFGGLPSE